MLLLVFTLAFGTLAIVALWISFFMGNRFVEEVVHEDYISDAVSRIPRVVANRLVDAMDELESRVQKQTDEAGMDSEPDVYVDALGLREIIDCSHPNETLCIRGNTDSGDNRYKARYSNYASLDEDSVKLFAAEVRDIVASEIALRALDERP